MTHSRDAPLPLAVAALGPPDENLPDAVRELWLFTGSARSVNLQLYEREGYERQFISRLGAVRLVHLSKVLPQE